MVSEKWYLRRAGRADPAVVIDFDIARGPEFPHPVPIPDVDTLGSGLEDSRQHGASGAVVTGQIGQFAPAADIRGFVHEACHGGGRPASG